MKESLSKGGIERMITSLGKIAESVQYGVTASANQMPVGPRFLRITDIQNGSVNWDQVPWCECDTKTRSTSNLLRGDIVFARTGATTGKSYLIKDCPYEAVFASYLIRLRLRDDVFPNYVAHFFQTQDYWDQITKGSRGAAQPGVNATTLKTLQIPLPPLAEQKRIAAILDAADALRAQRQQSLAHLDSLLQSTFLTLFGDPVTNPMGWEKFKFGDIVESRLGKMLDKGKETGSQQFPYLANYNVQWGEFKLDSMRTMELSEKDQKEFSLQKGDLLVCEGGEIGRCAIWTENNTGIFFQKALHRCRVDPKIMTPEYLQYYFRFMTKNGGMADYVTSATIAHLTGAKLKQLPLPLPPLALQQRFAAIVESIEAQKARHRAHLAELDTLFASLQHRAFNGEL